MKTVATEFIPVSITILTVSDSRTIEEDSSGLYLEESAITAGHSVLERKMVKNNPYLIRAAVSEWIADEHVQVILINGGTGFTAKNQTPEAIKPLFDREVEGFGEIFRMLSFQDIGSSALQSRAVAGMANNTLIFAMPGSTSACKMAWEQLICQQLDVRQRPCNFVPHLDNNKMNIED